MYNATNTVLEHTRCLYIILFYLSGLKDDCNIVLTHSVY